VGIRNFPPSPETRWRPESPGSRVADEARGRLRADRSTRRARRGVPSYRGRGHTSRGRRINARIIAWGLALSLGIAVPGLRAQDPGKEKDKEKGKCKDAEWTSTFHVEKGELSPTGRNPYFILEPGYKLVFAGKEDGEEVGLTITVLDQTRTVDGVETRVVEEHETSGGKTIEVSRNFFAISKRTNDVYYFGEDVDIYKEGKVVGHEGAWLSGEGGAKFGLAIPGSPLLGARYYQEHAPGKAMDRAEVVSVSETMQTPAGKFTAVLKTVETTPLEPGEKEAKFYAPGVGLIKDGPCKLVSHGTDKSR
jgi:hypothetical protein